MTAPTSTELALSMALGVSKAQPAPIAREKAAEVATSGRPVRLVTVSPALAMSAGNTGASLVQLAHPRAVRACRKATRCCCCRAGGPDLAACDPASCAIWADVSASMPGQHEQGSYRMP